MTALVGCLLKNLKIWPMFALTWHAVSREQKHKLHGVVFFMKEVREHGWANKVRGHSSHQLTKGQNWILSTVAGNLFANLLHDHIHIKFVCFVLSQISAVRVIGITPSEGSGKQLLLYIISSGYILSVTAQIIYIERISKLFCDNILHLFCLVKYN